MIGTGAGRGRRKTGAPREEAPARPNLPLPNWRTPDRSHRRGVCSYPVVTLFSPWVWVSSHSRAYWLPFMAAR